MILILVVVVFLDSLAFKGFSGKNTNRAVVLNSFNNLNEAKCGFDCSHGENVFTVYSKHYEFDFTFFYQGTGGAEGRCPPVPITIPNFPILNI